MRFFIAVLALLFIGCAQKDIFYTQKPKKEKIVFINAPKINEEMDIYGSINRFPFVSSKLCDIKNYSIEAKNISKITDATLFDYKIIYVTDIHAKDFKRKSNDILNSLAVSYGLTPLRLLSWIENGGILWIQGGVYVTGYEYFNLTPNFKKSVNYLIRKTEKMKLFSKNLKTEVLKARKKDFINYTSIVKKYPFENGVLVKKECFAFVYFLDSKTPYKIFRNKKGAVVFIRDYDLCFGSSRKIRLKALDDALGFYEIYGVYIKKEITPLIKENLNTMGEYLKRKPFKKLIIFSNIKTQNKAIKIKNYMKKYTKNIKIVIKNLKNGEIKFGYENE
jgi:hypothetical protein